MMETSNKWKLKYQNLASRVRQKGWDWLLDDLPESEDAFDKQEKDYQKKYEALIKKLENNGTKVKEVDSRSLRDYAGMNPEAAKVMGKPFKKDEFEIDKGMTYKKKFETLKHEVDEHEDMANGDSYWKAHTNALDNENKDDIVIGGKQ